MKPVKKMAVLSATLLLSQSLLASPVNSFRMLPQCEGKENLEQNLVIGEDDLNLIRSYFGEQLGNRQAKLNKIQKELDKCERGNCSSEFNRAQIELVNNLKEMRIYLSLSSNNVFTNAFNRLTGQSGCLDREVAPYSPNAIADHNPVFGLQSERVGSRLMTPLNGGILEAADAIVKNDFKEEVKTAFVAGINEKRSLIELLKQNAKGAPEAKTGFERIVEKFSRNFDSYTRAILLNSQQDCRAFTTAAQSFYHSKYLFILRKFPVLGFIQTPSFETRSRESMANFRRELKTAIEKMNKRIDFFASRTETERNETEENARTLIQIIKQRISQHFDNKLGKELLKRNMFVENLINYVNEGDDIEPQDKEELKTRLCSIAANYDRESAAQSARSDQILAFAGSACALLVEPASVLICQEAFNLRAYYKMGFDQWSLGQEAKYAFTKFDNLTSSNKVDMRSQNLEDIVIRQKAILKRMVKMLLNKFIGSPLRASNLPDIKKHMHQTRSLIARRGSSFLVGQVDKLIAGKVNTLTAESARTDDQLEAIAKVSTFSQCVSDKECMGSLQPEADSAILLTLYMLN